MIYIITKGNYSCYRVVAATTDRKIAKKIKKKFSDECDDCRIEEFPDAEVMLKNRWNVFFTKEGNVFKCMLSNDEYDYLKRKDIIDTVYKRDYDLIAIVEADTEEAAIKIAAEKRAKYLAEKNHL